MQWRKKASTDALKCWRERTLKAPEWQQTATYPLPAKCPRPTHILVSEVSSSNAMEKEGFTRCIEILEGKEVKITRVATDHHISIAS